MLQQDSGVRFPHQYVGKRVRYVEMAIEYKQRKPVKIVRILFLILSFNSKGMIDITEKKKESHPAKEAHPLFYTNVELPNGISDLPKGIVDARYLFARKRLNYDLKSAIADFAAAARRRA